MPRKKKDEEEVIEETPIIAEEVVVEVAPITVEVDSSPVNDLIGKKYHDVLIANAVLNENGSVSLTLDNGTTTIVQSIESL